MNRTSTVCFAASARFSPLNNEEGPRTEWVGLSEVDGGYLVVSVL